MKTIIFVLALLIAVPVFAANNGKKHKTKDEFSCPNGVENIARLAMMNPYDNEGKCFDYVGASVQLLAKNKALYSYFFNDRTPVALIYFGKESAPIAYEGLVVGKGAFSYRTVEGSQNIIHSLVAVPKDKSEEIYKQIRIKKEQDIKAREDAWINGK